MRCCPCFLFSGAPSLHQVFWGATVLAYECVCTVESQVRSDIGAPCSELYLVPVFSGHAAHEPGFFGVRRPCCLKWTESCTVCCKGVTQSALLLKTNEQQAEGLSRHRTPKRTDGARGERSHTHVWDWRVSSSFHACVLLHAALQSASP